jgi:Ca-activated chloride channel family protein
VDALNLAVQQHIKIYTIGVGSFGPVPFPYVTPEGKKTYRYDKADIDEALLRKISDKTGGEYFRASDPASLQSLFDQIDRLEKSEPRISEFQTIKSEAVWWAGPAALLGLCYIALTILIVRLP